MKLYSIHSMIKASLFKFLYQRTVVERSNQKPHAVHMVVVLDRVSSNKQISRL